MLKVQSVQGLDPPLVKCPYCSGNGGLYDGGMEKFVHSDILFYRLVDLVERSRMVSSNV